MKTFSLTKFVAALLVILGLFGSASSISATVQVSIDPNKDGENAINRGDFKSAQAIFSSALNSVGRKSAAEAYIRCGLGEALLGQGDFTGSSKELKKALALSGSIAVSGDDLKARILDDISWIWQSQKKPDKAMETCQQSLDIRRVNADKAPQALFESLMHMGYLCDETLHYDQAAQMYTDALAIQRKIAGPQSCIAARIEQKLATELYKLGRQDEAAKYFNEALSIQLASDALFAPFSPHLEVDTVVYSFADGSPNCFRKSQAGQSMQVVSANGVTVAAAVSGRASDFVKSGKVNVIVQNASNRPIQFLSQPPALIVLAPKLAIVHLLDPSKLASTIEKKGEGKAKWIRFWGQDATMPVTSTFVGNPGFWGCPPIMSYNGAAPIVNRSGNMTMVTTQVPDYAAQFRAMQKAQEVTQKAQNAAASIRDNSLCQTTIAPGQSVNGALYFDIGEMQKGVLRIPVGNAVFEYRLSGS
jgi:tetratricopeptide (TPR) repeat protein